VLGAATLSTMLVASGVMVLFDRAGVWHVHAVTFLAVLLAICGVGLVVGGFVGRSRGLIGLGVVLTLVTALASVVPGIGARGTGDVHWTPTTVAQLPADGYEWAAGQVTLDLRQLPVTSDLTVQADLGAGLLVVWMPSDVRVVVHTEVGLGSTLLPDGVRADGAGRTMDQTYVPVGATATTGGPTLTLELGLGVGQLEVHRAQA
jgi:hypothetical protein